MIHLELDSFWTVEKAWEDDHENRTNKMRFEKTHPNGKKCQLEVTPDSRRYGIKYYRLLTKP